MRGDQIKSELLGTLFAVDSQYANKITEVLNATEIARRETSEDIDASHFYQEKENVAIITIDGVTIKKNTWFNAMSGNFVPYTAIHEYIDKAESNDNITDVIFAVDTNGGDVEGVDRLGDRIYNMKKNTHTMYLNKGFSAGIFYGTASQKVYAEEGAMLGSIGVLAIVPKKSEEDDGSITLVSKNAENKNCALNGDCMDKIQARIDEKEDLFHKRVVRNTSLSREQIIEDFDKGSIITAQKALDIGFIDGITTLDKLIDTLVLGAVPAQSKPAIISDDKKIQGVNMSQEIDLVAEAKKRVAGIVALGAQYGVSSEVVQKAIENDTDLSDFKDVCLEKQNNTIGALRATNTELEEKLKASIESQAGDGEATVTPKVEEQKDDTTQKVLDEASKVEV